jgi:hypothetical protein
VLAYLKKRLSQDHAALRLDMLHPLKGGREHSSPLHLRFCTTLGIGSVSNSWRSKPTENTICMVAEIKENSYEQALHVNHLG